MAAGINANSFFLAMLAITNEKLYEEEHFASQTRFGLARLEKVLAGNHQISQLSQKICKKIQS